jgi:dTDP-4-dehydrorhamnose 3,5-epimerase
MPFTAERLQIPDVLLITPTVFRDDRGFFVETYKAAELAALGITAVFVQDNHSKSAKSVVRGLHYQVHPKPQAKLVRCCRGAIYDVCVDIRKGSPTFGRWVGAELTEENCRMMYVPVGFAHGFAALTEGAEIIYKCSAEYSRDHDRGILWNDPAIGIRWPVAEPVLSAKDQKNPLLRDAENTFA